MGKNFFSDISLEALIQYIEGNAETSVQAQVESWLRSDKDHAVFFEKLKIAWNDYDKVKNLTAENIDSDWEYILNHIDSGQRIIYAKSGFRTVLGYAAAIIILAVSVGVAYFAGRSNTKVSDNQTIVYNEIIVPKGEKSQLILSDGTKVWVNAGSKLKFPDRFQKTSREVWLEGEAFFEVAKDKARPFYVRTSDINIKVLGTKFNVKAYSEEDIIETTLVEGLVSIERKERTNREEKEILLQPNHKAIYLKNESSLITAEVKREIAEPLEPRKVLISKPVEVDIVTSWTDGKLIFEDETLESVVRKLERRYDVTINIEDESIKEIKYSGVLKNISIEQAMKAIQVTSDFRFVVKGNKINIYKN
jgi:ferric-dicitrate binding protein FerR (iron transport regulator)